MIRKLLFAMLGLLLATNAGAQASWRVQKGRWRDAVPVYGLAKVKALIRVADSLDDAELQRYADSVRKEGKALGHSEEEDWVYTKLHYNAIGDSAFSGLSLREKFTYVMINPDVTMQNCSHFRDGNEESSEQALYARLMSFRFVHTWGRRQRKFMKDNRDSVLALIREDISRQGFVGLNEKTAILDLSGVEMIPQLMHLYVQSYTDHDILTVFMLLMSEKKYEPFLQSAIYNQLYGKGTNWRSEIVMSEKTGEVILQLTKAFVAGLTDNFVLVKGGTYTVGKAGHAVNPKRQVKVDSFYISKYETTNREFAAFVAATNYVTVAERRHDALVFAPGLEEFRWLEDSTAYWRHPNGVSRGGIDDKMDHPVTCICYLDILAYCHWAGVRLPTLDEWEIASRAGASTDWFFGDDDQDIGRYANVWHGRDHMTADSSDGYMYTSPVGRFLPNAWGLYDVYGNVFEFCSGKVVADEPPSLAHARGGSWWCSTHACHYFNSYDIGRTDVRASFSNQGFRVASNCW